MLIPPPLVITEIMYDLPGSDSDREWIEITNQGPDTIALPWGSQGGSWRLSDRPDRQAGGTSHWIFYYSGADRLVAGESLILAAQPSQFLVDHPDYRGTLAAAAFSLPNSSGTLALSIDGGASWFGSRTYASHFGASGDGHSLEWIGDNALPSRELGGTPGQLRPPPPLEPAIPFVARFELSEVQYNPVGSDSGREWLELRNIGSLAVDLSTKIGQIVLMINDHRHPITLLAGPTTLAPGDRWLITRTGGLWIGPADHSLVAVGQSALTLPNQLTRLRLSLDDGSSWVMDEVYDPNWGGAGAGRSLERDLSGVWGESANINGTPGASPDVIVSQSLSKIVINEFLPWSATGEEEWIELTNRGRESVDLTGWQLDDGPGGSRPYLIIVGRNGGTWLAPGEYLVFTRSETGLILGNEHDQLTLSDQLGQIRQTIPYSEFYSGTSWMRSDTGLGQWTRHPTPGASNIWENQLLPTDSVASADLAPPVVRLADGQITVIDQRRPLATTLANLPMTSGWHVRLTGTVAESHAHSALMTDGLYRLRIRFQLPTGTKPAIHRNDQIRVDGFLTIETGEPVLLVTDPARIIVTRARQSRPSHRAHSPPNITILTDSPQIPSLARRAAKAMALSLVTRQSSLPWPASTLSEIFAMLTGLLGVLIWLKIRPLGHEIRLASKL